MALQVVGHEIFADRSGQVGKGASGSVFTSEHKGLCAFGLEPSTPQLELGVKLKP